MFTLALESTRASCDKGTPSLRRSYTGIFIYFRSLFIIASTRAVDTRFGRFLALNQAFYRYRGGGVNNSRRSGLASYNDSRS